MSKTIDERVVSMQFDNKQFEAGVATSMKTIEGLKESLNFSGAEKGLQDLNKSVENVNMGGLAAGVEEVSVKFSALQGIAYSALKNITDRAVDAGLNFAKSLSIDQISSGWSKYAEKTSAVQTIMAATAKEFDDTDVQMEYVNEQLEKLNWFTDETSYNFVNMVSSIGKFTSAGVSLEDSVNAMQGIANWAAISGADATKASSAMYQLSQALGSGAVKLQDWKSIENLNMNTIEFMETAVETAKAVGLLADAGNGMFTTLEGDTYSITQFRDSLKDGWFTSDILTQTLSTYGEFSSVLNEAYVALGDGTVYTTSQILGLIDDYTKGELNLEEVMKKTGMTAEELNPIFEKLSSSEYELGRKSFRAAQEAKTFEEAISATADAVSTGWMNTFEIIFGNYKDAKTLWTDLANELYEVFAESGNARNAVLEGWADLGGREAMLEGIANIWTTIKGIVVSIKDAFQEVFPPTTSKQLYDATIKFKNFTEKIKMSEEELEVFRTNCVKVFRVLADVINAIKTAISTVWSFAKSFSWIGDAFIDSIKALRDWVLGTKEAMNESAAFGEAAANLNNIFQVLSDRIKILFDAIVERFSGVGTIIRNAAVSIWDWINGVLDAIKANRVLVAMTDALTTVFDGLTSALSKVANFFKDKFGWVLPVLNVIGSVFKKIGSVLKTVFKEIGDSLASVFRQKGVTGLMDLLNSGLLAVLLSNIALFLNRVSRPFSRISTFFEEFEVRLEGLQARLKAESLLKIAGAIAILTISLIALSMLDSEKLLLAISAMGFLFLALESGMAVMSKIATSPNQNVGKLALMAVAMGAAMVMMAKAMKVLGSIESNEIDQAYERAAIVLMGLLGAMKILTLINQEQKEVTKSSAALIILVLAMKQVSKIAKSMKEVSWTDLSKTGAVMAALLVAAAAMGGISRYAQDMQKASFGIFILSGAMVLVASVSKMMKKVEWTELAKTGAVMAALLVAAAALGGIGRYAMQMNAGSAALLVLSIAMMNVALIAAVMKKVEWAEIGKAGAIMAALLVAAAALGAIGRYAVSMAASSAALLIFSVALGVFAAVCKRLEPINLGKTLKTIAQLLIALTVAALGVAVISPILTVAAIALGTFGTAVVIFATALGLAAPFVTAFAVSSVAAMTSFVASLGVLLAGVKLMIPLVLDIIDEFFTGLVNSFVKRWETVINGLKTLGGTLLDAVNELMPKVHTLIVTIINDIFDLIKTFKEDFWNLITDLVVNAIANIRKVLPEFFGLIKDIIHNICEIVRTNQTEFMTTLTTIGTTILQTIRALIPEIFGIISEIISGLILVVTNYATDINEAAFVLIQSFMESLRDHIGEIATIAADICINFINAITEKLPEIIQAGFNLILGFINGLADGIEKNTDAMIEATSRLITAIITSMVATVAGGWSLLKDAASKLMNSGFIQGIQDKASEVVTKIGGILGSMIQAVKNKITDIKNAAKDLITGMAEGISSKVSSVMMEIGMLCGKVIGGVKGKYNDMIDAGEHLINGMKKGIQNALDSIVSAAENLAGDVVKAFKDVFKIKSPSRVMMEIGGYISEGMAIGIDNEADTVLDSVDELSTDAVAGAKSAMEAMADVLNSDTVVNPTVVPVVDASAFSADKLNVNGTLSASIGRPVSSLSRIVADAQAEIYASNNEVITAINSLRTELSGYYNDNEQEIALYVDSTKMASSLAKPLNRQFNMISRREAY